MTLSMTHSRSLTPSKLYSCSLQSCSIKAALRSACHASHCPTYRTMDCYVLAVYNMHWLQKHQVVQAAVLQAECPSECLQTNCVCWNMGSVVCALYSGLASVVYGLRRQGERYSAECQPSSLLVSEELSAIWQRHLQYSEQNTQTDAM